MILLNDNESKHCLKVLRLGIGDLIQVTDGCGNLYSAKITGFSPGNVSAEIVSTLVPQISRRFRLHLAVAPTKNQERFEWFAEKATEIGIDEITPLICQRSERRKINSDRLKKILVSAMKQSLVTTLPLLSEPQDFTDIIRRKDGGQKFIANNMYGNEDKIETVYTKGSDLTVLIGPEGDFTDEEISLALTAGFQAVSLGRSRLRTETAGIYVASVINMLNSSLSTAL
jgi:16S rRNA (uracil1498-N3)-methyltransferase